MNAFDPNAPVGAQGAANSGVTPGYESAGVAPTPPQPDRGEILSYDPATGQPIYGKKVAPGGAYEYFVANVGTVYADSLEGVLQKLSDAGVANVSTADVGLVGVTTHKEGN